MIQKENKQEQKENKGAEAPFAFRGPKQPKANISPKRSLINFTFDELLISKQIKQEAKETYLFLSSY